jgi:hypothetical protein
MSSSKKSSQIFLKKKKMKRAKTQHAPSAPLSDQAKEREKEKKRDVQEYLFLQAMIASGCGDYGTDKKT